MPGVVLFQKWPYSLPSDPTYNTGIEPELGFAVPGAEWPVLNSVPVVVALVLNHSAMDRYVVAVTRLSGSRTAPVDPSKLADVNPLASGPAGPPAIDPVVYVPLSVF